MSNTEERLTFKKELVANLKRILDEEKEAVLKLKDYYYYAKNDENSFRCGFEAGNSVGAVRILEKITKILENN